PAGVAIYPDREIRISHARADEINESMLADVSGRIRGSLRIELRIAHRIDGEEASLRAAVQPEESTQDRIVHVDHAPRIVADPGRHIRGEIDGDRIGERAAPLVTDSQALAYFGVAAIRGDQILGTQLAHVSAIDIHDGDADIDA